MAAEWYVDGLTRRGSDERPYVRTPEAFPIRYRQIPRSEFEKLKPLYLSTPTIRRQELDVGTPALSSSAMGPVVSTLMTTLQRIERKLDLLLAISGNPVEEAPKDHLFENAQCVDLSGSGIRFSARRALEVGWHLKIIIRTPTLHPVEVSVLADVVRAERRDDALGHIAACRYSAIHEDDRESIISYTFKRQRELVRMRSISAQHGE